MRKSAILVDGAFFIKRYRALYPDWRDKTPNQVARDFYSGILRNLRKANQRVPKRELYRILFYDCTPLTKKVHNPISNAAIDYSKTREAEFRRGFHGELKKMRKVALRLGRVADGGHWTIKPKVTKQLLRQTVKVTDLEASDVIYDVRQKGVDMKIGLDIASLSYKQSVDQIILIAGDSDFVPAAKLARREGVDIVLDPMWNPLNQDLHEHIDGMVSCWPKPTRT